MNSPQGKNEKQQQEQQQPPTTYARSPLDRLLWNCVAYGALTHNGHHLNEKQLQWVVDRVTELNTDDETAADYLCDLFTLRNITPQGQLVGTVLPAERQLERCLRIVQAVRRGDA